MVKRFKDPLEREKVLLREELHQAGRDVACANAAFDMALEPDLVAACIFELNAARLRYSCLLRRLRQLEAPARQI